MIILSGNPTQTVQFLFSKSEKYIYTNFYSLSHLFRFTIYRHVFRLRISCSLPERNLRPLIPFPPYIVKSHGDADQSNDKENNYERRVINAGVIFSTKLFFAFIAVRVVALEIQFITIIWTILALTAHLAILAHCAIRLVALLIKCRLERDVRAVRAQLLNRLLKFLRCFVFVRVPSH